MPRSELVAVVAGGRRGAPSEVEEVAEGPGRQVFMVACRRARAGAVASPRRLIAAPVVQRRAELVGVVADGHDRGAGQVVEQIRGLLRRMIRTRWPELADVGSGVAARDVARAREHRGFTCDGRVRAREVAGEPIEGAVLRSDPVCAAGDVGRGRRMAGAGDKQSGCRRDERGAERTHGLDGLTWMLAVRHSSGARDIPASSSARNSARSQTRRDYARDVGGDQAICLLGYVSVHVREDALGVAIEEGVQRVIRHIRL